MVARKHHTAALLLVLCSLNAASACYFARQGGWKPSIGGEGE